MGNTRETVERKDNAMGYEPIELSAYLDGELSPEARRQVEQRLATDAAYAEELRQLERTKTMMTLCMETPRFHDRLLETARHEAAAQERRRTSFLMAATAAATLITLAAAWLYLRQAPPPSPDKSHAPLVVSQENPLEAQPFAVAEAPAPDLTGEPPERPVVGALPLEVVGTVTGENPTAIVGTQEGGRRVTHTHRLGDEVLPGVTLTAIGARSVTFDHHGAEVTVPIGRRFDTAETDRLAGLWAFQVDNEGDLDAEQFVVIARIAHDEVRITAGDGDELGVMRYLLTGQRLEGHVMAEGAGDPIQVSGRFDRTWNRLVLDMRESGSPHPEARIILERVENQSDMAAAWAAQEMRMRLKRMYADLHAHAREHNGQFPGAPEDLPQYGEHPEVWHVAAEEIFVYHPGRTLPTAGRPSLPDRPRMPAYEPAATYPDRLMAHERQLAALGHALPEDAAELIRLENRELGVVASVSAGGRIHVSIGENDSHSNSALAAMRAQCQNNLKQLGLVIKMFENEHHGYSPPGWLTCYPEYLTDPSVLTCPKDPPGTDSYQYLFPATHMEEYARQFHDDPENPAARAMAMSQIPTLLNRTDFPGTVPGRNVLFMDGHVEWIRTDSAEWRERIVPFLR